MYVYILYIYIYLYIYIIYIYIISKYRNTILNKKRTNFKKNTATQPPFQISLIRKLL